MSSENKQLGFDQSHAFLYDGGMSEGAEQPEQKKGPSTGLLKAAAVVSPTKEYPLGHPSPKGSSLRRLERAVEKHPLPGRKVTAVEAGAAPVETVRIQPRTEEEMLPEQRVGIELLPELEKLRQAGRQGSEEYEKVKTQTVEVIKESPDVAWNKSLSDPLKEKHDIDVQKITQEAKAVSEEKSS